MVVGEGLITSTFVLSARLEPSVGFLEQAERSSGFKAAAIVLMRNARGVIPVSSAIALLL